MPSPEILARSFSISSETCWLISAWRCALAGSLRKRKSFSARRPSSSSTAILLFSSKMVRAFSAASR
ncbi:hypothetical protein [Bradyrhizobium ottawaense]|uniref:hypothetical protein n=1 Tax=Bradyrhizobium ottawaense TaxID=931866 RepID=UPI00348A941D